LLQEGADPEDTNMIDMTNRNNSKRMRLADRFAKVEGARPALP